MPGREAGKAKPLKAPKSGPKEYDDDDLAHLAKKKEVGDDEHFFIGSPALSCDGLRFVICIACRARG